MAQASRIPTRTERARLLAFPDLSVAGTVNGSKFALLNGQLHATVNTYAGSFRMTNPQIPQSIRNVLNGELDAFASRASRALTDVLRTSLLHGDPADKAAVALQQTFTSQTVGLTRAVETYYEKAAWYQILLASEQAGYQGFRVAVEQTDGTCARCLSGQAQLYTLDELVNRDLLPPLHPHCRCTIAPANMPDTTENAAGQASNWYDPLLRIPFDAKQILDAFISAQQARLSDGTLAGVLDWLTLGIVSGFSKGLTDRTQTILETPSLYNLANWLTLGFADEVKGAVSPEQPLSLEH